MIEKRLPILIERNDAIQWLERIAKAATRHNQRTIRERNSGVG
jgi:hypothetical protein